MDYESNFLSIQNMALVQNSTLELPRSESVEVMGKPCEYADDNCNVYIYTPSGGGIDNLFHYAT